ncbi:MAG: sulfurtransferase [bacterium]|nr:sulfurtransferase [bacterium]MDE0287349.1 sulfurtransferase [bacterium]MDE0439168.1 sulfurtransferase [bacterium]
MTTPVASCWWLAERLDDPDIRVVDTRWYLLEPGEGRQQYEKGHIPGAVFLDLDTDLSAPTGPGRHPLPAAGDFGALMGRHGIGNHHHVVVYDQGPGSIAARLWWMLRSAGHGEVSVLDGGYGRWTAEGHPTTADGPEYPQAPFKVSRDFTPTIDRHSLRDRLGTVQVIDARPADRYRGENETVDPAAGHIPTSISAPTDGNLGRDGLFKSPDLLARRFADLGVDPGVPVVSSCGSGVTACHNIIALVLAGWPEATLYPGSWSDWSTAGFPVATGAEPGTSTGAPAESSAPPP